MIQKFKADRLHMKSTRLFSSGLRRIVLFCALALSIVLSSKANAGECLFNGAEYTPQNPVIEKSFDKNINVINRTLSFVLRLEFDHSKKCIHSAGCNYLSFDAYDRTGQKVSTMRFGNEFSNGVSRESFSTYWGMYCTFGKDNESDCKDMKPFANFYPIGVSDKLEQSSIHEVPEILIFPGTFWELNYNSYQQPENWDKYIKFYTKDRIYPDFRGYDFWVRKKCGGERN